MEAVITKPKQSYAFDHKLTDEEIEELIENYDYTPDFEDDGVLYDMYDNPTESMIRWEYENRHGLAEYGGPYTLEELAADWEKMLAEVEENSATRFGVISSVRAEESIKTFFNLSPANYGKL